MTQTTPFVITISRQLGSGAAYIGQQLAARLHMLYLDREILQRAAQQLQVSEAILQSRDETAQSLWQQFLQSFSYGSPEAMYAPPPLVPPTDHEVFQAETQIITQVVATQSAVVVGRGGVHVLRSHPRHVSVFLYAGSDFRSERVAKLYRLAPKDARAAITTSDQARARYHRMVSGKEWSDAKQYSLCLDTGVLGITATIDVILAYVQARFDMFPIADARM